jgi:hypothetical protein
MAMNLRRARNLRAVANDHRPTIFTASGRQRSELKRQRRSFPWLRRYFPSPSERCRVEGFEGLPRTLYSPVMIPTRRVVLEMKRAGNA